jgi:hypothetical protein
MESRCSFVELLKTRGGLVFQKLIPLLLFTTAVFGQTTELSRQIALIKELAPDFTRFGILYNPSMSNVDNEIQQVTMETGVMAIKSPVKSIREISDAVRALAKYDVNFIFLYEDKIVTGPNSIKFVVKQTVRKQIPVFTTAEDGFKGGAFGRPVKDGDNWILKINSKVLSLFTIKVPENNIHFVIEE